MAYTCWQLFPCVAVRYQPASHLDRYVSLAAAVIEPLLPMLHLQIDISMVRRCGVQAVRAIWGMCLTTGRRQQACDIA